MVFQALGSTVKNLNYQWDESEPQREGNCLSNLFLCLFACFIRNQHKLFCIAKQSKVMCLFCLSCFRSFFSFPLLFFFFLPYICFHYILYYFFLTLLFLYLIWLPCDTELFEHISVNILPLATCLGFFFLFSSALSTSKYLLLLYLSLILFSSSVFSAFPPSIFFLTWRIFFILSCHSSIISCFCSPLHPYPLLLFLLLNSLSAHMSSFWGILYIMLS